MNDFTPFTATIGGLLIGLSISMLFYFNGKVAGISGIFGGLFNLDINDKLWRVFFLLGMIVGAGIWLRLNEDITTKFDSSLPILLLGGFLTGFGTQLASGCTSGHGVLGIARLSFRSIIATIIFLIFGAITVFIHRNIL